MRIRKWWTWLVLLGVSLLFFGCGGGGGGGGTVEPGLVGIDDDPLVVGTAPLLLVEYVLPGNPNIQTASILSDQLADGDIAYDPVLNAYTITEGPDVLQFGVDSLDPNRPEYRAFLDFPLDGSTLDPAIPLDAVIQYAEVGLFVNFVDFAPQVPALFDLVEYPIGALGINDYVSTPLAVTSFVFLAGDVGNEVIIDVTNLMVEAQARALVDFQLRLLLVP